MRARTGAAARKNGAALSRTRTRSSMARARGNMLDGGAATRNIWLPIYISICVKKEDGTNLVALCVLL